MKPIKFHELSFRSNPLSGVLIICAGLFPALSLFDLFDFMGERNVKLITALSYLVLTFQLGARQFFYRNYVQWNKRGINIRVNDFWGKNFPFHNIRDIIYAEEEFTIITVIGSRKTIDLAGIDGVSKSKLLAILRTHTEGR